jgi:hypothetical protein
VDQMSRARAAATAAAAAVAVDPASASSSWVGIAHPLWMAAMLALTLDCVPILFPSKAPMMLASRP